MFFNLKFNFIENIFFNNCVMVNRCFSRKFHRQGIFGLCLNVFCTLSVFYFEVNKKPGTLPENIDRLSFRR